MDFVKNLTGGGEGSNQNQNQGQGQAPQGEQKQEGGGFFGGIGDKLNSAAGGGKESEKNEDYIDKGEPASFRFSTQTLKQFLGVDYVQEKFLGQGAQDNESAVEQAKDEQ